jgi:hypothetical protein
VTRPLQQPVAGTDQLAAVCEWKEMQLNEIGTGSHPTIPTRL